MYEFHWPTRTIFQVGLTDDISQHIPHSSEAKLLIAAPRESWVRPLLNQFSEDLLSNGWKSVATFAEIEPNPSWKTVEQGIQEARKAGADTLLAVGGGSSMDAGKVIAERSPVQQLITMPTTAGTGGEISPWAVISNLTTREKDSVVAKWPDITLMDPVLTTTVPPVVTLFTGIDAFIHGLEAYLASASNAITDALALQGMRLVTENLTTAIESGNDLPARSAMLEGSLLTGAAMLHAGLGLMHAIGNVTGGLYHELPHGLILMRCMNAVLAYNQPAVGKKYSRATDLVDQIQEITSQQFKKLSVPALSVREQDLDLLAERAAANVNAETNPRPASPEDIKALVRDSFQIVNS